METRRGIPRIHSNRHIILVFFSGMATIDIYEKLLRQIKFVSKSPIAYFDRTFSLVCIGTNDRISTNEIRVQVKFKTISIYFQKKKISWFRFILNNRFHWLQLPLLRSYRTNSTLITKTFAIIYSTSRNNQLAVYLVNRKRFSHFFCLLSLISKCNQKSCLINSICVLLFILIIGKLSERRRTRAKCWLVSVDRLILSSSFCSARVNICS